MTIATPSSPVTTQGLPGRLISGAWWSGVGSGVYQVLALLASVLVARQVAPETFGAIGILTSTVATFGMVGAAGMGLTAVRYVAELRQTDPARASRVLGLATVTAYATAVAIGAVAFAFAGPIAAQLLNAPLLAPGLRIASLAMVLAAITSVQGGALVGFEAFRQLARINLVRGGITIVALPLGARWGGTLGVMVALAATGAVTFVLGEWAIHAQRRGHGMSLGAGGWREWRLLVEFALPSYFTGFVYPAVLWALGALIVRTPEGLAAMAVFAAASQWRIAVAFLPQLLSQPSLTILANSAGWGDAHGFRRIYRLSLWLTTLGALVPAVAIAALAPLILSAYGASYVHGAWVLVLLAATVALNAPCLVVGSALASRGRMWLVAGLNVVWAAVAFGAWAALDTLEPAVRAAAALAIAHTGHLTLSLLAVRLAGVAQGRGLVRAAARAVEPPRRETAAAVVVTRNVNDGFPARLARHSAIFGRVVVVDNGSEPDALEQLRDVAGRLPNVSLIANGKNLGIATALNRGVAAALRQGAQWLATFDDDTLPSGDLLEEYARLVREHPEPDRLALVNAAHAATSEPKDRRPWHEPALVIQSGTLFPRWAVEALGPFADEFFMDYVDLEYCLRARSRGYRIAQTTRPLLEHAIGVSEPHRLLWRRTSLTRHSPARQFTIARNLVRLVRRYLRLDPAVVLWLVYARLLGLTLILLFDEHRVDTLRINWRGTRAGFSDVNLPDAPPDTAA